ncbi:hypothetical protein FHQ18_00400 [Deferribacter autotrophicus]|uniref:Uncharacterized protein n=1 Tax=Deferribacter autotrophicus TaxID=500465 RepID=A0A5A8F8W7_9BACT|nr:hypothetical protein [Deferribacter autotrophicus]KAA0259371.1 hypothetical protein FHQ18_00400 [Deferribacter autotrophicus]
MKENRQGFFKVNTRKFYKLFKMDTNEILAYLVFTAGTSDLGIDGLPNNRFTEWGAESLHRYLGLPRTVARRCIKKLLENDIIREVTGKSAYSFYTKKQFAGRRLSPTRYKKTSKVYDILPIGELENDEYIYMPNMIINTFKHFVNTPKYNIIFLLCSYIQTNWMVGGGIVKFCFKKWMEIHPSEGSILTQYTCSDSNTILWKHVQKITQYLPEYKDYSIDELQKLNTDKNIITTEIIWNPLQFLINHKLIYEVVSVYECDNDVFDFDNAEWLYDLFVPRNKGLENKSSQDPCLYDMLKEKHEAEGYNIPKKILSLRDWDDNEVLTVYKPYNNIWVVSNYRLLYRPDTEAVYQAYKNMKSNIKYYANCVLKWFKPRKTEEVVW